MYAVTFSRRGGGGGGGGGIRLQLTGLRASLLAQLTRQSLRIEFGTTQSKSSWR